MTTQNVSTQPSYAKVANKSVLPKKEQAIVCDIVDGVTQEQYIFALGEKTKPENIVAASRITQNRFCWYLTSAELVDQLTLPGNDELIVGEKLVTLRPFIARMKRVILSNVHLAVPNEILLAELERYGVKMQSTITPIKVGVNKPGYTHILSFRRQLFVEPEVIDKLPSDFTVNYEESTYHIFVTTDKLVCFACKKVGHVSKHCELNKQAQQTPRNGANAQQSSPAPAGDGISAGSTTEEKGENDNIEANSQSNRCSYPKEKTSCSTPQKQQQNVNVFNGTTLFTPFQPVHKIDSVKRPHPSSDSSSTTTVTNQRLSESENEGFSLPSVTHPIKKVVKKSKNHEAVLENYIANLTAAKIEISQEIADTFPIEYDSLINFITDIKNDSTGNIQLITNKYTENYESLIIMLRAVHSHVDSSTKHFITRTISGLKKLTDGNVVSTDDEVMLSSGDLAEE